MKKLKMVITTLLVFASIITFAQNEKTDSFKVYGNCGMCERRIEKAVGVEGVSKASWSSETKIMIVTYDPAKITNDDIQKKIAAVGHDTEKFRADDNIYSKLPGCCLYERKKETKDEKQ